MANWVVAQQQSEKSLMRSKKPASSSSTKTAGAPVFGYAKRPRARAANRLSAPGNQIGETKSMFAVALGQPVRAIGVRRRKRRRPSGALEDDNKGKRAASDSAAGIWRNEAKFLNDDLVVQNEPPAVIANGKNNVISSPTITDHKESGDRLSSRWIMQRSNFLSNFRTWPRPREPRPKRF